jgi:hypothetical protein
MEKIEIEKTENWWILTYWDEYEDTGLPYSKKLVFEYEDGKDFELNELKALEKLLWEVNEKIGVISSKHNKHNININVL